MARRARQWANWSRAAEMAAWHALFGRRGSASGDTHVPCHRRALVAAIDDKVMALRLARDRLVEGRMQERVALGGSQWRAEIGRVFLPEAHIERTGAGDAHAVAGFAEIVGQRRDETEPTAGFLHANVATRAP